MKNKRLLAIAELISKEDNVVDVGCDHGYLAIYLKEQKKCSIVIASDINKNALEVAKKNIMKKNLTNEISCILSDGLENIPIKKVNTIVIAGMGTHTILQILSSPKIKEVKKIILQSNNDYELLRRKMNAQQFQIINERYVNEKGHDYFIIEYQKGIEKLTDLEFIYGKFNQSNKEYYQKCLENMKQIRQNMPKKKQIQKWQLKRKERKLLQFMYQTKEKILAD